MAASSRCAAALILMSACGFPRPADVPGPSDAATTRDGNGAPIDAAPSDVPDLPGVTLHISPTGDDANDGFKQPLKTLKHAIGLAAANSAIQSIVLASGRYSTALGETFPYTVPPGVTIIGPAGGGAVLAGSTAEAGLMVDTGSLQDLEFDDFTVAITATSAVHVTNVHVQASRLAVRGQSTAKLAVNNLDITGVVGTSFSDCERGIELNGAADLVATKLTTRNLVTALTAKDASTITITQANMTEDPRCGGDVFEVSTSKTFVLSESFVVGGSNGIAFVGMAASPTQATITNTTMRGLISALSGISVVFQMTGGDLSNNSRGALDAPGGSWAFTNVTIRSNGVFGVYLQGATLTMRGCTVTTNNGDGVYLFDGAVADLGTAASPGNNIFQSNTGAGVDIFGTDPPRQIDAAGNTWNPNIQGSGDTGTYAHQTISGPVGLLKGANYAVSSGLSVRL